MKETGLSTGIAYQHAIEDVLAPIRHAGFRTIEVATATAHFDLRRPEAASTLARRLAVLDLRVHSLHAPFGHGVDLTSSDPTFRERSLERLTRAADALQTLGGELYVIHPGGEDHDWVWDRATRMARSLEGLAVMWERCRERGLVLVVETPLPHLLGGHLPDLEWLLERLPAEGTGVCIDTSHTSLGGSLFDAIARFGSRLVHVQASDNRGVTDDHLPPGEGIIDWGRVTSALDAVGYRGVFMLEVTGDGDVPANVERASSTIRRFWPEGIGEPGR